MADFQAQRRLRHAVWHGSLLDGTNDRKVLPVLGSETEGKFVLDTGHESVVCDKLQIGWATVVKATGSAPTAGPLDVSCEDLFANVWIELYALREEVTSIVDAGVDDIRAKGRRLGGRLGGKFPVVGGFVFDIEETIQGDELYVYCVAEWTASAFTVEASTDSLQGFVGLAQVALTMRSVD